MRRLSLLAFALALTTLGQSLYNRNLILNPGAEAGSALDSSDETKVNVPNWNTTGTMTAAKYNGNGFLDATSYGPRERGAKYFTILDSGNTSTATQTIDLSAAAMDIDAGRVRFYLEGYLGGPIEVRGAIRAVFLDAAGRTLLEAAAAAPVEHEFSGGELLLRTVNGFLLPNTRSVRVVLELRTANSGFGFSGADNLSLQLNAEPVIGQNLVVNGDAETDEGEPSQNTWNAISGWNTPTGMMAVTYYGARLADVDMLPDNRGRSLFGAYFGTSAAFQTIDLTLIKDRIDSGGVGYQLSGYFGGFEDSNDSGKDALLFLDANGRDLGSAVVGPVTAADRGNKTGLLKRAGDGAVPAGTRQIRVTLTLVFTGDVTSGMYAYADNISLVLTSGASAVSLNRISNSASGATGAVAPGEMVTLAVSGVTLDARASMQLDSDGKVRRDLAGVKVYFDGTQAPILYVKSSEIAAVVPFDVDGKSSTQVRVEYLGVRSNAVSTPVARTAPGVFTQESGAATGRGLIYGDAWTLNSTANPAAKGSLVSIIWTGGGQTNPAGVDGRIETQSLPRVAQPVTVSIGGQAAEVVYAGAVYQGWAGLLMAQVKVPSSAAAGDALPVVITVGGASSQAGVTIAVR